MWLVLPDGFWSLACDDFRDLPFGAVFGSDLFELGGRVVDLRCPHCSVISLLNSSRSWFYHTLLHCILTDNQLAFDPVGFPFCL